MPIELVDTADIPGGGQLHLMRSGDDFAIQFGDEQLMVSWEHGSERALANLVCDRLGANGGRLLIGGLGMGFTLGAALEALPMHATVVVAELVPKVVTWASGPLAHFFDGSLSDPRVSIALADVHDLIEGPADSFDAILLDVDNGPDGFIRPHNERLYCNWGLRSAYKTLSANGILAIWSAYADSTIAERLEGVGFIVDKVRVRTGDRRSALHTIWLASKSV